MTLPIILFISVAVILILLLTWAVRPPKKMQLSVDGVACLVSVILAHAIPLIDGHDQ